MHLNYKHPQSSLQPVGGNNKSIAVVAVMATLFAAILIVSLGLDQIESTALLVLVIGGLTALSPRIGIIVTFVYLAILGDLRRYIFVTAGPVDKDPLLFVGPVMVVLLCGIAVQRQQLSLKTPVAKSMLALLLLMILQVFNPLQGGLDVGVAGALAYIIPALWFWVGQSWGTEEFLERIFYRVVVPVAVPAAILGLLQTIYGFLPFEAMWVRLTHAQTISVNGQYRSFSFFVSPAEYILYVDAALLAVIVPLALKRLRLSLLLAPMFALAVILFGARGPIIYGLLAVVVVWAVQDRRPRVILVRGVLALLVGVAGVVYVASQAQDVQISDQIDPYINREAEGFLKPQDSTAGVHGMMFLDGVKAGIENPAGNGLGASTASAKSGVGGTEVDISNMFNSLGVIGGLFYLFIFASIWREAFLNWQRTRTLGALVVIAFGISQFGNWLNGGHYALSALVWFAIGSMDISFAQTAAKPAGVSEKLKMARILPRRRLMPVRSQHT